MKDKTTVVPEWLAAREAELAFYSPYNFLRELSSELQQEHFGAGVARRFAGPESGNEEILTGEVSQWLLSRLNWDSDFFGTSTFRLFTGLYDQATPLPQLVADAAALRQELSRRGSYYAFTVVPAEDVRQFQALTGAGWALVETRLTYYREVDASFQQPRYPVRGARPEEAAHIGRISAQARNMYDRFHADPWFGEERADAFLARYAEAATEGGYADVVLVPDEPGLPVDSFLAIGDHAADSQLLGLAEGMSRVLLTAVGPANRGWHLKLVSETVQRAHDLGQRYVLMTTQATNRAVFRTTEKLGFRLGGTSHVLASHGGGGQ